MWLQLRPQLFQQGALELGGLLVVPNWQGSWTFADPHQPVFGLAAPWPWVKLFPESESNVQWCSDPASILDPEETTWIKYPSVQLRFPSRFSSSVTEVRKQASDWGQVPCPSCLTALPSVLSHGMGGSGYIPSFAYSHIATSPWPCHSYFSPSQSFTFCPL